MPLGYPASQGSSVRTPSSAIRSSLHSAQVSPASTSAVRSGQFFLTSVLFALLHDGWARRVWDPTIIAVEASHWRVRARLGNPTLAKNIPNPRLLLLSSFSIRRRLLSSSPLGGSPPHVLLPAPAPCSPPRSSSTRGSEEETGGCFTSWGPGRRRSEDKGTGWWCSAAEARCTGRWTEHAGGHQRSGYGEQSTWAGSIVCRSKARHQGSSDRRRHPQMATGTASTAEDAVVGVSPYGTRNRNRRDEVDRILRGSGPSCSSTRIKGRGEQLCELELTGRRTILRWIVHNERGT